MSHIIGNKRHALALCKTYTHKREKDVIPLVNAVQNIKLHLGTTEYN